MALIECPECGREISDQAVSCPHCGYPMRRGSAGSTPRKTEFRHEVRKPDPAGRRWRRLQLGALALIVAGLVFLVLGAPTVATVGFMVAGLVIYGYARVRDWWQQR